MRVSCFVRLVMFAVALGSIGTARAEDAKHKPSTTKAAVRGAKSHKRAKSKQGDTAAGAARRAADLQAEAQGIAVDKLEHGTAPAIEQALSSLASMDSDAAARAVTARLRRGLPPQLTEAAIDSLVLLKRGVAAPVLLELATHRRSAIRAKAVIALGALNVRTAQSALLSALDDPSAEVRAAAAQVLGHVGNTRALPVLYTAAQRGVTGAWVAIGELAGASDIDKLLAQGSGDDVTQLRPALDTLFTRRNLPVVAKLRLVRALEDLGSPSARACVVEWLAENKTKVPEALRAALVEAVKRLDQSGATEASRKEPAKSSTASVASARHARRAGAAKRTRARRATGEGPLARKESK